MMIFDTLDSLLITGGVSTSQPGVADDLYVACASFEPRAIALSTALSPTYRTRRTAIYYNREFLESPAKTKFEHSIAALKTALSPKSDSLDVIQGSWLDPSEQVAAMRNVAGVNEDIRSITIDITTFNREALMVCMAMLRVRFPSATVRTLYISPDQHGAWLSRGFRKVRSVVGFSGIQRSNRGTALILLSGFEGDRTVKLIEEHEPSCVYLGFGDPPTMPNFLERNLSEHKLVLDRTEVRQFRFPANSIPECTAVLRDLSRTVAAEFNVIMAPMSTKLSTVACFLVSLGDPSIQVTYCLPGEYNLFDYSTGTGRVFIDTIS